MRRKGRGTAISRRQRQAAWPVFEEMLYALSQKRLITIEEAAFQALHLLETNSMAVHYKAVIVDETQDMSAEVMRLLAAIAKTWSLDPKAEPCIFMAGDGQQRIYARTASLSACGINVRGRRSERLKITYRTTEEIRRAAICVLSGEKFDDMDEGEESLSGTVSRRHGPQPMTFCAQTMEDECRWIAAQIQTLTTNTALSIEQEDICIVVHTQKLLAAYQEILQGLGITSVRIERQSSDDRTQPGVRIATMHRVKGLEFKAVFIAGAGKSIMPFLGKHTEDNVEQYLEDLTERSLFYVAASRAKDALFVRCTGEPGDFLQLLINEETESKK